MGIDGFKWRNSIADNKRNDIVEIFYDDPEELPEDTRVEDRDLFWRTKTHLSDMKKISAWDLFNFCVPLMKKAKEHDKKVYEMDLRIRKLQKENRELYLENKRLKHQVDKLVYFADWFASNGDWHTDWDKVRSEHLIFEKQIKEQR